MTTAQRIMMALAQQYDLLTLSGNEITDRIRALPDQGDGLSNDGSFGVWPAATNRAINSNFKTNTTSFIDVGATTTRETSGLVGADTTRGRTVTANAATAEGTSQLISGGAAGTQYTYSAWFAGSGTIKLYVSDSVSGKQLGAQITLSATPTKYSVTATTGALSADHTVGFETDSQQAITVTHGRWMAQTGAIATPHVLTDGAIAVSSAGRVQLNPTGLITPTQGWIFILRRHGWTTLPGTRTEWAWGDDTPNRILGYWAASPTLSLLRSSGSEATNAGATHSIGDIACLGWKWSDAQVGTSYNGGAFTVVANATIPTITATQMDLGSQTWQTADRETAGDILAFALGSGPLVNGDAGVIKSALLNRRASLSQLPGNCKAYCGNPSSGVFQRRR